MLPTILILVIIDIILQVTFFIVNSIKLNRMENVNTAVEADVTSLKNSLTTISDKLGSIASDEGNTLTPQSKADLDEVTTAFSTLASSLAPPPVTDGTNASNGA